MTWHAPKIKPELTCPLYIECLTASNKKKIVGIAETDFSKVSDVDWAIVCEKIGAVRWRVLEVRKEEEPTLEEVFKKILDSPDGIWR